MPTIVSSYIKTTGSTDARTADSLSFPFTARPQAMSVYLRFQERGNVWLTNGTRILHIGTAGAVAPFFSIAWNGSVYTAILSNGITAAVTALLSTAPVVGQMVELLVTISSAGAVIISQSLAGAALSSGSASARLPPAWAGTTLYLNSTGAGGTGICALLNVAIVRGVQDIITMRRLADVP